MIPAVLTAALAAAMMMGPPPAGAESRLIPSRVRRRGHPSVGWTVLALLLPVVVAGVWGVRVTGWVVCVGVAAGTVAWVIAGRRRRRREASAAEDCAQAARALASLLRAGNIPHQALAEAATDFPVLASAASAARLGADVARELDRAASRPGLSGMRPVAAAWRLSERTGAPIAGVLSGVAETLRRQRQVEAVVETELAAARTSGHIMAALPLLAVGLGLVAGVNTPEFLLTEPLGQLLTVAGVLLTAAGVLWVEALARPGPRGGAQTRRSDR
ncbi:type II secretion system F family protein [Tessaracoccus sp. Z1128]